MNSRPPNKVTTRDYESMFEFHTIPGRGTTLTEPLTGWRFEWTDGRKLWNFDWPDIEARAHRCPHKLTTIGASLTHSHTHEAPHPDCECGHRVVGDLEVLSTYLERLLNFYRMAGVHREKPLDATGLVIARVQATGYVTRGLHKADPPMCIRTGEMRLLDIYAPDWTDQDELARRYPGATVHPFEELPPKLFPSIRQGPHPEPCLAITQDGSEITITFGLGTARVPTRLLHDPEVCTAVLGLANPDDFRQRNADLEIVIDRLLSIVRPDITAREQQTAAANAISWALGYMAAGH